MSLSTFKVKYPAEQSIIIQPVDILTQCVCPSYTKKVFFSLLLSIRQRIEDPLTVIFY